MRSSRPSWGHYKEAVSARSDSALKKVAAPIGANEAQHLTALSSWAAGGSLVPNPSPLAGGVERRR